MAAAFQVDAFQNDVIDAIEGFQVEAGAGPGTTLHWRVIRGDQPGGTEDWMVSWNG